MLRKRGTGKNKTDFNLDDVFKHYSENSNFPIKDKKLYKKVILEINSELMRQVVEESLVIKLPRRMGQIYVSKRKPSLIDRDGNFKISRLCVDWNTTVNHWSKVYPNMEWKDIKKLPNFKVFYFENKHSDGFMFKIIWDKNKAIMPNKSVYKFDATRGVNRNLGTFVKDRKNTHNYILK